MDPEIDLFSFKPEDFVTLLIGPDEEAMMGGICFMSMRSAFFETALKKEWSNGKQRVIQLPEQNTELFKIYLHAVHNSYQLPLEDSSNALSFEVLDQQATLLTKLFCLGERMQDTYIRNKTILWLYDLMSVPDDPHAMATGGARFWTPGADHIETIFSGTPPKSPVRRLFVDCFLTQRRWPDITHDVTNIDFLQHMCRESLKRAKDGALVLHSTSMDDGDCSEYEIGVEWDHPEVGELAETA